MHQKTPGEGLRPQAVISWKTEWPFFHYGHKSTSGEIEPLEATDASGVLRRFLHRFDQAMLWG
ncbi:MAG TPA: hypothetical protein VEY30_03845, partial [Myxococcaceae bacterium]|nr:hypothetical protein [Myxococcaceae bacterium]